MDCETFDRDVVDLLYGEGETSALALHAETCPRCAGTLATLRSGRELGAQLPRVTPPEGLSRRILAAAAVPPRESATFSRRVARAASWAGSLAMRPQFAMAALFCLAVGSSLLLLRARTDSLPGPTSVREAGLPAPEPVLPEASPAATSARRPGADRGDERALEQAPAAAPAAASPPAAPGDATADAARAAQAQPALDAALSLLASAGCAGALADLRSIATTFPGTAQAERAAREVEACVGPLAVRTPAAPAPPPAATPPSAGGAVASGGKAPPAKASASAAASASAGPR